MAKIEQNSIPENTGERASIEPQKPSENTGEKNTAGATGTENTAKIPITKIEQNSSTSDQEKNKNATPPTQQNRVAKPQWFGATLAAATHHAPSIPVDPFPLSLRQAIEPHIEKARIRRKEALQAIRNATGDKQYDSVLETFLAHQDRLASFPPSRESTLHEEAGHRRLVESLLDSAGFSPDFDLSLLHQEPRVNGRAAKDRLLHALTQNYKAFQESYNAFVRNVCIPRMENALGKEKPADANDSSRGENGEASCNEVYYQAFPCLRIVSPGEFSIGPHSDVSYGHHPCSVNGYVSLTVPDDSQDGTAPASALFLESRPGAEDWHALFGGWRNRNSPSRTQLFAGALNLHWTTENMTPNTRVTLDFRMIQGRFFSSLACGGKLQGGQKDVFRATPGYYHRCVKTQDGVWVRDATYGKSQDGALSVPDFRVGFPWTVKSWEKFWKKHTINT